MNIPLSWLAEYVDLPKSEKELTDRLTMIGHMLDKRTVIGKEVVLDLELRGNRSDLFGLLGIAREVGAAFDYELKLPATAVLPKVNPKMPLLKVEAAELIKRFTALTLAVTVSPSPAWLVERLKLYGVPSINNVVDITNYVMIETGEPMHAFDLDKLHGKRLILRRAKKDEPFTTFLGTQIKLTTDDLVLADNKKPQGTMIIGGKDSGVGESTTTILLEAAVYDQANVRRSSRRHSIRTDAGTRHEKFLDPNQVPFALSRALYLLKEHAQARVTSALNDFYPEKREAVTITTPIADVERLVGLSIPLTEIKDVLTRLGCEVKTTKQMVTAVVPTFRTDITESADIIEEIARIHGYENIPNKLLAGELPEPATPPSVVLEEKIRDILVNLQSNEVITSPFIRNDLVPVYQQTGEFPPVILLANPPDKETATLRPSLIPNLVHYAKRAVGFRQERIAFFEIGRTYHQKKQRYFETRKLAVLLAGKYENHEYTLFDLKGVCEGLLQNIGIKYTVEPIATHPSLEANTQGTFIADGKQVGTFGMVAAAVAMELGITIPLFAAEFSIDTLLKLPKYDPQPYAIAPQYPPVIEDLSFTFPPKTLIGTVISAIKTISPLINTVSLVSQYENTSSFRIEFLKTTAQITAAEVHQIRGKIIETVTEKFSGQLKGS